MEDPILEFLRSQARNYRCRVCGSNHKGSQLRKIGNHNNKLIVQVTCGRCRDSFFLHVEFAGSINASFAQFRTVTRLPPRVFDMYIARSAADKNSSGVFHPWEGSRQTAPIEAPTCPSLGPC